MKDEQAETTIIGIDQMREADIDQVVAIERQCGLSSRHVNGYLRAITDQQSVLLVAIKRGCGHPDREVVGIFSALIVIDELQIDNLAVVEHWRRKGIASDLLFKGLRSAFERGARSAILDVRQANSGARLLYERSGFVIKSRRSDYYCNPQDDALIMTCQIEQLGGEQDSCSDKLHSFLSE